jgi:DDE domain
VNAAKAFLRKAMKGQRTPTKITLDAYAVSHRAVADLKENGELPKRVLLRSSKYLNNLIEQDHRRIKQRLRPMLGLKSFRTAAVVIGGIELAEKIKKRQFKIRSLGCLVWESLQIAHTQPISTQPCSLITAQMPSHTHAVNADIVTRELKRAGQRAQRP